MKLTEVVQKASGRDATIKAYIEYVREALLLRFPARRHDLIGEVGKYHNDMGTNFAFSIKDNLHSTAVQLVINTITQLTKHKPIHELDWRYVWQGLVYGQGSLPSDIQTPFTSKAMNFAVTQEGRDAEYCWVTIW